MGLNITVQKGHDFSSGNVTRAALNAGATPTIAVTGSISGTELADSSVTNAKVSTNADIAVSKLALAEGSLILGGSDGNAAALAPSSSYNHGTLGNEADKNCGLLIDTGTNKWQVLNTDVSVGGQVSITKYRADSDSSFILKLKVVDGSLSASHINKDTTLDMASLAKNSGGKLCVADNGVHWDKFYNHKNSAGNLRSAFLSYGVDGKAIPSEITEADQVLVSAGSNANSTNKSFFKNVDLLTPLVDSTGWKRAAHGLGRVPLFVELFLVCTGTTHTSTHKYAVNDVIKAHHDWDAGDLGKNKSSPFNVGFDSTYVWVHHIALGNSFQLPKKYGTATPDENTHSGSDVDEFNLGAVEGDFKLVARVCG